MCQCWQLTCVFLISSRSVNIQFPADQQQPQTYALAPVPLIMTSSMPQLAAASDGKVGMAPAVGGKRKRGRKALCELEVNTVPLLNSAAIPAHRLTQQVRVCSRKCTVWSCLWYMFLFFMETTENMHFSLVNCYCHSLKIFCWKLVKLVLVHYILSTSHEQ